MEVNNDFEFTSSAYKELEARKLDLEFQQAKLNMLIKETIKILKQTF